MCLPTPWYHCLKSCPFLQPKDPSLGLLGPTLRAKVGDTIRVVFKNNCGFTTSLHPHGVFYEKDSEGSPYNDGTTGGDHLLLCAVPHLTQILILQALVLQLKVHSNLFDRLEEYNFVNIKKLNMSKGCTHQRLDNCDESSRITRVFWLASTGIVFWQIQLRREFIRSCIHSTQIRWHLGFCVALKGDDAIHTGSKWTYNWFVTERAAPGPLDGSSMMWMYHSHSHEIQDSYAGLMGGIVVVWPVRQLEYYPSTVKVTHVMAINWCF